MSATTKDLNQRVADAVDLVCQRADEMQRMMGEEAEINHDDVVTAVAYELTDKDVILAVCKHELGFVPAGVRERLAAL